MNPSDTLQLALQYDCRIVWKFHMDLLGKSFVISKNIFWEFRMDFKRVSKIVQGRGFYSVNTLTALCDVRNYTPLS